MTLKIKVKVIFPLMTLENYSMNHKRLIINMRTTETIYLQFYYTLTFTHYCQLASTVEQWRYRTMVDLERKNKTFPLIRKKRDLIDMTFTVLVSNKMWADPIFQF